MWMLIAQMLGGLGCVYYYNALIVFGFLGIAKILLRKTEAEGVKNNPKGKSRAQNVSDVENKQGQVANRNSGECLLTFCHRPDATAKVLYVFGRDAKPVSPI